MLLLAGTGISGLHFRGTDFIFRRPYRIKLIFGLRKYFRRNDPIQGADPDCLDHRKKVKAKDKVRCYDCAIRQRQCEAQVLSPEALSSIFDARARVMLESKDERLDFE